MGFRNGFCGQFCFAFKFRHEHLGAVSGRRSTGQGRDAVAGAGIDLVLGSKGDEASIGLLQSPKNPRDNKAWKYHSLYKAGWIMSLISCDMDHDGDLDVLASDRRSKTPGILWLENPGAKALSLIHI